MKNIKLLLIGIIIMVSALIFAQTPDWQWAKSAAGNDDDDYGNSIAVDASGNVYITGEFNSSAVNFGSFTLPNNGNSDIYIVKYAPNGIVLWAKSAGGSMADAGTAITADASGNVYVTGNFQSPSLQFGTNTLTNTGETDIFLVKYDANGNVLWATSAGGIDDDDFVYGIDTDNDRNVIITGGFASSSIAFGSYIVYNAGILDMFIAKYDSAGTEIWAKSGNGTVWGTDVSSDVNGNIYVTGSFDDYPAYFLPFTLNNNGSGDIFLVKYDANGNVLWANGYGGIYREQSFNLSLDGNGNIYVSGYLSSDSVTFGGFTLKSAGASDMFLVKFDTAGIPLWGKTAGGDQYDYGAGGYTDVNGNSYIIGDFDSDSIQFDNITLYSPGFGYNNLFVAKYDNAGNVLWAKSAEGYSEEAMERIVVDANNNIFVTGAYAGSLTFGSIILNNGGGQMDIFVAKYGQACSGSTFSNNVTICGGESYTVGNTTYTVSGTYKDTLTTVAGCDSFVTTFLTVNPSYTITIDTTISSGQSIQIGGNTYAAAGNYTDTLSTVSNCDSVIILNLNIINGESSAREQEVTIKISPNPFNEKAELKIRNAEPIQNLQFSLYNSFGKTVRKVTNLSYRTSIERDDLPAGIYFYTLSNERQIIASGKLTIQ